MSEDPTWFGPGLNVIEQVENTCEIDLREGKCTGKFVFTVAFVSALSSALGYSKHPDYAFLYRKLISIAREEANVARVTITFEGLIPDEFTLGDGVVRTYELEGATSTEPIETHPDFETFAGTPAAPLNGAIFDSSGGDDDGKFKGFSAKDQPVDPAKRKTGVKSYLSPGAVYTENITRPFTISGGDPTANLESLGTIDTPVSSPMLPTVHSTRNWLLISCVIAQIGEIGVRERRSWRLSGPRGWDPDIYANAAINK